MFGIGEDDYRHGREGFCEHLKWYMDFVCKNFHNIADYVYDENGKPIRYKRNNQKVNFGWETRIKIALIDLCLLGLDEQMELSTSTSIWWEYYEKQKSELMKLREKIIYEHMKDFEEDESV